MLSLFHNKDIVFIGFDKVSIQKRQYVFNQGS